MARLGASVFTCSRHQETLDSALTEWTAASLAVGGCVADVSNESGREALIEAASAHFKGARSRATPHSRAQVVMLAMVHECLCERLLCSAWNYCVGCSLHRKCGCKIHGVPLTSTTIVGVLHVLVNNVGTNTRKPTTEYSASDFDALMATNLQSAFNVTQRCYSMLKAAQGGCVVFNSSVAGGPLAMKSGSIYAMTKGAPPCTL